MQIADAAQLKNIAGRVRNGSVFSTRLFAMIARAFFLRLALERWYDHKGFLEIERSLRGFNGINGFEDDWIF